MAPPPIVRLLDLDGMARFRHEAMATGFELFLPASDDKSAQRSLAEEVFRELDRIEGLLSFYREGSDVTKINRAAKDEVVRVSEIAHDCLLQGMQISAASEGAFDPFAGHASLVAKGQKTPHHLRDLPEPGVDDIAPVLSIDPDSLRITKLGGSRWLDLGAIGKGAALDAMAEVLRDWEVETAVLNGGGSSVLVFGPSPSSERDTWRIALPQSRDGQTMDLAAPFALGASGEGFQPGHVVNTAGKKTRPQSLVLAPNATLADALSTAFLLMDDEAIQNVLGGDSRFAVIATHRSAPQVSSGVFQTETQIKLPEVSLIIPCWCESQRLPPFLSKLTDLVSRENLPLEIIVVDDGSPGEEPRKTAACIEQLRSRHGLLRAMKQVDSHCGKGGAILHGWQKAAKSSRWLAFVDADGAIPPEAVIEGIQLALSFKDNLPIIAANRYHRTEGRVVERGWFRQRSGGWFAKWAQRQLGFDARDSQCGFKLVPASWWRERSQLWREIGYAFDLELLLAAKDEGVSIENFDIPWREIGGSNVSLRDGIELVQTVKRLKKRV